MELSRLVCREKLCGEVAWLFWRHVARIATECWLILGVAPDALDLVNPFIAVILWIGQVGGIHPLLGGGRPAHIC